MSPKFPSVVSVSVAAQALSDELSQAQSNERMRIQADEKCYEFKRPEYDEGDEWMYSELASERLGRPINSVFGSTFYHGKLTPVKQEQRNAKRKRK